MIDVKCFPMAGVQKYTVEDFQYYLGSRVSGVFSSGDNLATVAQAVPNMSVKVKSGAAWLSVGNMRGISFPMITDADLAIDPADALLARIDTVVIGVDKTNRKGYIKIVKGLAGGGAVAPIRDDNYFELVISEIHVRPGGTEIIQTDIIDKRANESVCGFMRNGFEQIVNNLDTNDQTKVLSAAMGKQLQDEKAPKANPTFTGTATIPDVDSQTITAATLNAGTGNISDVNATGLSVSGNASFGSITGTVAGGNAPAGKIGEFLKQTANFPSMVSMGGSIFKAAEFALPAGDWDVSCIAEVFFPTTVAGGSQGGCAILSLNPAATFELVPSENGHRLATSRDNDWAILTIPRMRVSTATGVTVYFKVYCETCLPQVGGICLTARRIR